MDLQIKQLIKGQKLVTLSPDNTVEEALNLFHQHRITSAPVLQDNKSSKGLIDVLDLLSFLVKTSTKPLTDTFMGESRKLTTDDMTMLRKRAKDFKLAAVGELVDWSERNPFMTLIEDQTVKDALEIFSNGIHRIVVLKREDNDISGILSQTNVVNSLILHGKLSQFKSSVDKVENKTTKLISVPQENLAIDSFLKMDSNNLSSLAVVDAQGKLIGNLSAADLRVAALDFNLLLRSTRDFLAIVRKEENKPVDFIVSCQPKSSLHDAVKKMNEYKCHRIYMVDNDNKPLAVISLTDIIKELYTHA